jgi:hypothetical protein
MLAIEGRICGANSTKHNNTEYSKALRLLVISPTNLPSTRLIPMIDERAAM